MRTPARNETIIAPMVDVDVPAVLTIEHASPEGSPWDEEQLRGELSRSWAHLWVLRAPHLVAFLATWLVQDELHVLNIATDPAHRRRGHARALLEHALRFAIERGVRIVLLEVRRSNAAAIGLYRKLGFAAMGLRARYYSNDEDAVEMVLRIDPTTGAIVPSRDEIAL